MISSSVAQKTLNYIFRLPHGRVYGLFEERQT